jgi:hypothetical protein
MVAMLINWLRTSPRRAVNSEPRVDPATRGALGVCRSSRQRRTCANRADPHVGEDCRGFLDRGRCHQPAAARVGGVLPLWASPVARSARSITTCRFGSGAFSGTGANGVAARFVRARASMRGATLWTPLPLRPRLQLLACALCRRVSVSRMLEICMSGSMRGSGFIPAPYSTDFVAHGRRTVTLSQVAPASVRLSKKRAGL